MAQKRVEKAERVTGNEYPSEQQPKLPVEAVAALQQACTVKWHLPRSAEPDGAGADDAEMSAGRGDALLLLVERQHRANFDLWHQEDDARDPAATPEQITSVKHAIDHLNQQRNDLAETIDNLLLQLAGQQNHGAPLHSETPGMMIDRMSILSLKVFHTRLEACRREATDAHRVESAARLHTLEAQRTELTACLGELWSEVAQGTRRFKLYRQMKMYNDPASNPVLYGATKKA